MEQTIHKDLARLRYGAVLLVAISTIGIGASLLWNIYKEWRESEDFARIESRAIIYKDIIFRKWNSGHNGVYAPVSKDTLPNKYLDVPERDIALPGGKRYTLINPAYMTRQIFEIQEKERGIRGHLTSLRPIRLENAPDAWETGALREFQRGKKESSSIGVIDNRLYMRFMQPLITEESCLVCHAKQGYRTGDIRGGISVAVPMEPFRKAASTHIASLVVSHVALWLLWLAGILLWFRTTHSRAIDRARAVEDLRVKDTAIATSSNGIAITGLDGVISYCNESFSKMWRNDHCAAICGSSIFPLLRIDDPTDMLSQIKDLGNWYGEIGAVRSDGTEFYVLLTATLIRGEEKNVLGITFSFSDISMRKNAELALKKSEEKLRERNIIMERDLKIAQLVQLEMISQDVPVSPYLDIEFKYLPVDKVGGDYFNFYPLRDDGMGVFIGDVSGHGVASALFHSLIKSSTDKLCRPYCTEPNEYLYHLNNELFGHMTSHFITAIYGTFFKNPGTGEVRFVFSNAGHPPPVVVRSDGAIEAVNAEGSVIGINENFRYEKKTLNLAVGDRLFFYTDGIPETVNIKKEIIGFEDRLLDLFNNAKRESLELTVDAVIDQLNAFRGSAEFKDDILLIGIEIT